MVLVEESGGERKELVCMNANRNHPRYKHGLSGTELYRSWQNMIARCHDPTHVAYRRYGAAGIFVCDGWRESVKSFSEWALANGYREGLSIDRIDNSKGYCPSNCRWVTMKDQAWNRRVPGGIRKSPFIGVEKSNKNKWRAYIRVDGKKKHLGTAATAEEAAQIHDREAVKSFGEKARLNFSLDIAD
jgi:hypothetical protein